MRGKIKGGGEGRGLKNDPKANEKTGRQETLYEAHGDDASKADRA